jgi:serine/threonine-protein kinase
MSSRKVAALIVGGAGVVAVGVGGVFGLEAISKNSDSKANGCNGNVCNAAGFATRHDAQTDATISDVLMGVGAAALVGGVVLWIIAPSSIEERAQAGGNPSNVGLRLSPTGVFLTGAFE